MIRDNETELNAIMLKESGGLLPENIMRAFIEWHKRKIKSNKSAILKALPEKIKPCEDSTVTEKQCEWSYNEAIDAMREKIEEVCK
jgi:hypothetical protein